MSKSCGSRPALPTVIARQRYARHCTLPVKIFSDLQVQYTPVAAAVSGLLILLVLAVILPLERWVGLMSPRDGTGKVRKRRR